MKKFLIGLSILFLSVNLFGYGGDGLGDHKAKRALNMNGKDITNISSVTLTGTFTSKSSATFETNANVIGNLDVAQNIIDSQLISGKWLTMTSSSSLYSVSVSSYIYIASTNAVSGIPLIIGGEYFSPSPSIVASLRAPNGATSTELALSAPYSIHATDHLLVKYDGVGGWVACNGNLALSGTTGITFRGYASSVYYDASKINSTGYTQNIGVIKSTNGFVGGDISGTSMSIGSMTVTARTGIASTGYVVNVTSQNGNSLLNLTNDNILQQKGGQIYITQATPADTLILSNLNSGSAWIRTNSTVPLILGANNGTQLLIGSDGGIRASAPFTSISSATFLGNSETRQTATAKNLVVTSSGSLNSIYVVDGSSFIPSISFQTANQTGFSLLSGALQTSVSGERVGIWFNHGLVLGKGSQWNAHNNTLLVAGSGNITEPDLTLGNAAGTGYGIVSMPNIALNTDVEQVTGEMITTLVSSTMTSVTTDLLRGLYIQKSSATANVTVTAGIGIDIEIPGAGATKWGIRNKGNYQQLGGQMNFTQATPADSLIITNATSNNAAIYTNTTVPLKLGANNGSQLIIAGDGSINTSAPFTALSSATFKTNANVINNFETSQTLTAKNVNFTSGTVTTLNVTGSLITPVEYSTMTLLAVFTSTGNTTASMIGQYVDLPIDVDYTPKQWECWGNVAGTFTCSITTAAFANTPVFGNSIAGTDSPNLAGTQCSSSTALTGWGGNIPQGTCLRATCLTATLIDQITLKICVWKRR